jgi:hypothetical protein
MAALTPFVLAALLAQQGSGSGAAMRQVGFDGQKAGEPPADFSCGLTGQGRAGSWRVVADPTAPSPPNVLAQMDEDATSYRFPVCVLDGVSARDVDLSVRFKPIRGTKDQAAGLVWRYRDIDNYYVVRANALEGNVVLYKVEAGKRTDPQAEGRGAARVREEGERRGWELGSAESDRAGQPVRGLSRQRQAAGGGGFDLRRRRQGRCLDEGRLC